MLLSTEDVLRWGAQYTKPVGVVQMMCDHLAQKISLQNRVIDLQVQQFLLPLCEQIDMENTIPGLGANLATVRTSPAGEGRHAQLGQDLL